MEIDFQGYKFTKTFFIFLKTFQRRKCWKK